MSNWSVSLLCSIHLLFLRRKCIEKSCRKLIAIKCNSLTFHRLCLYKRFSQTSVLKNSPTFPWLWKIFVFPWQWQPWSSKAKTRGQRLTENYFQSQLTPWISRVKWSHENTDRGKDSASCLKFWWRLKENYFIKKKTILQEIRYFNSYN